MGRYCIVTRDRRHTLFEESYYMDNYSMSVKKGKDWIIIYNNLSEENRKGMDLSAYSEVEKDENGNWCELI